MLIQPFADSITSFGVHRFVHLVARHTTVYYYLHTFIGRFSHFYPPELSENGPYGMTTCISIENLIYNIYLQEYHILMTFNIYFIYEAFPQLDMMIQKL